MKKEITALAVVCLLSSPAWAVNKCSGPGGRIVFQDLPCQGSGETLNIRPASGRDAPQQAAAQPSGDGFAADKPTSELERLKQSNTRMENERKRQEIELVVLPNAYADLNNHLARCEREYRALQATKQSANNNLAGATWEQSLSQEMSALTTKCDMQSRQINNNIEEIKKQCQKVGGCK